MKVVILAGGSGTRLWPLSRAAKPKQVQPFLDSSTLLQHTWSRLRQGFAAHDIFVSTTAAHQAEVAKQLTELPRQNIIVEPIARNTAAAIGLAALVIEQRFSSEVVAVVSSDHFIKNPLKYVRALRQGEQAIKQHPDYLALLGVIPTYPETGYGYIKRGRKLKSSVSAYQVAAFAEKPSFAKAKKYLASSKYLWNAGLFVFYPQTLLAMTRAVAPVLGRGLINLKLKKNNSGQCLVASGQYSQLPSISFDYAVVEKTKKLLVLPMSCGWTDVGHWRTIYDILSPHPKANVIRGSHVGVKSQGNLVYGVNDKLIATVGINNSIIVETSDAILICDKKESQNVKLLIEELKKRKLYIYV